MAITSWIGTPSRRPMTGIDDSWDLCGGYWGPVGIVGRLVWGLL